MPGVINFGDERVSLIAQRLEPLEIDHDPPVPTIGGDGVKLITDELEVEHGGPNILGAK